MPDLNTEPRYSDEQALEVVRGFVGSNCIPSPEYIEAFQKADFVVVSGQFVGAGKSTFIQDLEQEGRVNLPSCTNRDLRPGEVEGVDKVKLSLAELATAAEDGDLLDLEEVRPKVFYATPAIKNTSNRYVKDVELKGAMSLRQYSPDMPIVVPLPPLYVVDNFGLTEWERRVAIREGYKQAISDMDINDLQKRLEGAGQEVDRIYDEMLIGDPNTVIIVNDILPLALQSMRTFLKNRERPQRPDELGGYLRVIKLAVYLQDIKQQALMALSE